MEAYVAPGRRTERSLGGVSGQRARVPPDAAGPERDRVPQPDAALEHGVPRGVLLQAPDRQGDPPAALRGLDLPVGLRLGGVLRLHPPRQDAPRPSGSAPGIRRSSARRTSTSRSRTTAWRSSATAPRGPSTSRGGWACRWSRPATRTTSPATTPPRTTSCSASAPARRSTTRRGCGSRRRSSTSAARRRCTRRCPATRRRWPPRPGSPRWSSRITRASAWAAATSRRSSPARGQDARGLPRASSARTACATGTATTPRPRLRQRLDHELGIINRMGFASYFLIVWDFVRYARERGIPALARGSACGAIVSYLLQLSSVCPLKYDLLFERFLDPNRSEAPDIDIDLCQDAPLRGHRVRPEEVRRRQRRADRHVRHAQGQGGDQGRRPGDEHPAGAGRADQQAGPAAAEHHARGRDQGGARAARSWPRTTPRWAGCSTSPGGSRG